jgi:peptide/nickel transport system permease protein
LSYAGRNPGDTGIVQLSTSFYYPYAPPDDFKVSIQYVVENISKAMVSFKLTLTDTNTTEYEILQGSSTLNVTYGVAGVSSASASLRTKLFGDIQKNPAEIIFASKGNCTMSLKITFQALSVGGEGVLHLNDGALIIYGKLHGILGTDAFGHDVYSQILYGAYMSMLVGVLTAFLTTVLSVVIGTIAGYLGGWVDEVIMRVVDVILCIPFFVVLLTLSKNYRLSVILVVVVIAFFWWPGPARTIRSKILALKESKFVEGARAAGGSKFYIVRRHLLPNILPLIMASLILFVPGGILMEASLSFLGFGDPTAITWGRMLSEARQTGAFASLAWWYVVPPGLAISLLCLSFVFIGHSLDTIVNPRLRRRK